MEPVLQLVLQVSSFCNFLLDHLLSFEGGRGGKGERKGAQLNDLFRALESRTCERQKNTEHERVALVAG
jgi:hypothetical protein